MCIKRCCLPAEALRACRCASLTSDGPVQGITPNLMGKTHDCGGPCEQADHCCDGIWQEYEADTDCGGSGCLPCSTHPVRAGTAVERSITASGTMSARGCFCYVAISNLTIPCPPENSTAAQASEFATIPIINEEFVNVLFDPEGIELNPHKYVDPDRRGGQVDGSDCISVAFLSLDDAIEDSHYYVGKYIQISGGPGAGQYAKILEYNQYSKMVTVESWKRNEYEVCLNCRGLFDVTSTTANWICHTAQRHDQHTAASTI